MNGGNLNFKSHQNLGAVILVTGVAAVFAFWTPDVATARQISWNSDGAITRIGSIRNVDRKPVTLERARRAFGKPTKLRRGRTSCRASWRKIGLTATFTSFGVPNRRCGESSGKALQTAAISSRRADGWRAGKGLKLGDTFETMTGLYPEAYFDRIYDENSWVLAEIETGYGPEGVTPSAWVQFRDDRIRKMTFWIGAAGD